MTVSQWLPQLIVAGLLFANLEMMIREDLRADEMRVRKVAASVIVVLLFHALLWWGGFYAAFSG